MGIEPTQSAWKAEVLPLNYTRIVSHRCTGQPLHLEPIRRPAIPDRSLYPVTKPGAARRRRTNSGPNPYHERPWEDVSILVEGGGFEPPKAEPSDLQSDPFDRSGTPPKKRRYSVAPRYACQLESQCPRGRSPPAPRGARIGPRFLRQVPPQRHPAPRVRIPGQPWEHWGRWRAVPPTSC